MNESETPCPGDGLVIRGVFARPDGSPVCGAAVHQAFLGDPPSNLGTSFDLDEAPAFTDAAGGFRLELGRPDERLARRGPPGCWRRGSFFVLAARGPRALSYAVASGDELARSPLRLAALPTEDIMGCVCDEAGRSVAGARVEAGLYLVFVGRGPHPSAPVNFWLSRAGERACDLAAATGPDGRFVIPGAPMVPGQLHLTVAHPDFATLKVAHYAYQPPMRLTLQAGASVGLQVSLQAGAPAAGFTFMLEGVPEGSGRATHRDGETDEAGRCEFRSLPPGSYTARYLGGGPSPWAWPRSSCPGWPGGSGGKSRGGRLGRQRAGSGGGDGGHGPARRGTVRGRGLPGDRLHLPGGLHRPGGPVRVRLPACARAPAGVRLSLSPGRTVRPVARGRGRRRAADGATVRAARARLKNPHGGTHGLGWTGGGHVRWQRLLLAEPTASGAAGPRTSCPARGEGKAHERVRVGRLRRPCGGAPVPARGRRGQRPAVPAVRLRVLPARLALLARPGEPRPGGRRRGPPRRGV